ncbi:MAG: isochorismate synthase [Cryomorphaceae bacterium]|nr:isochorismate synthase [Cryomorphaceae bacterium]
MNSPFIVWSYPGETHFNILHEVSEGDTHFVFAPFHKNKHPFNIRGAATTIELDDLAIQLSGKNPQSSTSEVAYENAINRAVDQLKNHHADKVVVSAITSYKFVPQPILWLKGFREQYPQAFIYLIQSEETGTWLGATPERLVSGDQNEFKTISLAGTRKSEDDTIPWGQKEALEQSIVTDYLRNLLIQNGAENIRISRAQTLSYGTLQHLASDISFQSDKKVEDIANMLHPTPAVCGTPLEKALEMLPSLEEHERKFYTGYLGTLDNKGKTALFVNLRCMELFEDGICCYTGCGITEDSIAEDEWHETRLKLRSMVSIIEKMQNLSDILIPC